MRHSIHGQNLQQVRLHQVGWAADEAAQLEAPTEGSRQAASYKCEVLGPRFGTHARHAVQLQHLREELM